MGILKSLVIATTGTLTVETSQLKKWIEANDGRYSPQVRKGVTHLITGKDAWRNATDPVQAAVKVSAWVVTYDWLEDSLHRKRKLAEKKYTWEQLWQEKKRRKEMKKLGELVDTKRFNDGCEEAKKATGSGMSTTRRSVTRKPKQSKSFFFADVINKPFASAADDLKRRREDRETARAKKVEEDARKSEASKSDRLNSCTPSLALSSTSNINSISAPSSATSHAPSAISAQSTSASPGPEAKKPSLKDLYHYYLDVTGFEYKILLSRCNLRANEITRYRLSILESHTKPHVYCTFVEYFPSGGGVPNSGDAACFQALIDFNTTFTEGFARGADTTDDPTHCTEGSGIANSHDRLSLPQSGLHNHPHAAHLRSLLTTPTPSPTTPYKTLIAPMNSSYNTAWHTFRHAFRDLTLLSWEERFDVTKILYKTRARHFNIEPFVYVRPKPGLPIGLRVQDPGLFQNQTLPALDHTGAIIASQLQLPTQQHRDNNNDGYVYNAFSLPSLSHPLGIGVVGTAVQNDMDAARKAAEREKVRAEAAEEDKLKKLGIVGRKGKKPNYSRPLFNGVTGRPVMDALGRSAREREREWPSERGL
ncbi:hypothetical protein N0V94_002638 [Neodidymelliopsis sp. IMI 364377]|nr:hypothetical protein N0V94_002638 [Neodidymelliopsis sp. IMI 364377]